MIKGFIEEQYLRLAPVYVVADTIDYLTARFVFQTADWDGLRKWAHFCKDGDVHDIELTDDMIPDDRHLNLTAGQWYVWLHGTEEIGGEVRTRITTNKVGLFVHPTGDTSTDSPFPAQDPSEVEKLYALIGDTGELSTAEKGTLVGAINEAYSSGGGVDPSVLDDKMDKVNPTGSGAFSMGRKESSIVGESSHTEGEGCSATVRFSHAEGYKSSAGTWTGSGGDACHAEGKETLSMGTASHAEGVGTSASAEGAHAEGINTTAQGHGTHAEGTGSRTYNGASHAEGNKTTAFGAASHSEGKSDNGIIDAYPSIATNISLSAILKSWKEKKFSLAYGIAAHSEGYNTFAYGYQSHAEGKDTVAGGESSHTEGEGTYASAAAQHAEGRYNIIDETGKLLHIVGNGSGDDNRSNAHTLDDDGNAWYAGTVESKGLVMADEDGARYTMTFDSQGAAITDSEGNSFGLGSTQPDWAQNDDTQPDYVKNRTHWVETSGEASVVEILPETVAQYVESDQMFTVMVEGTDISASLTDGGTYTVMWNGVEYDTICTVMDIGGTTAPMLGDAYTMSGGAVGTAPSGEPFGIAALSPEMVDDVNSGLMIVALDGSTELTIAITGKGGAVITYHPLDKRFIPAAWLANRREVTKTIASSVTSLSGFHADQFENAIELYITFELNGETITDTLKVTATDKYGTFLGASGEYFNFTNYSMSPTGGVSVWWNPGENWPESYTVSGKFYEYDKIPFNYLTSLEIDLTGYDTNAGSIELSTYINQFAIALRHGVTVRYKGGIVLAAYGDVDMSYWSITWADEKGVHFEGRLGGAGYVTSELPAVGSNDEGKVLTVENGEWKACDGLLSKSGGALTGALTANAAASPTAGQVRNIFLSTSIPSADEGSDGDLWFVYE